MNRNALVFHDLERTAGFFIHFCPALVSWTMRWRFDACAVPLTAAKTGVNIGKLIGKLLGSNRRLTLQQDSNRLISWASPCHPARAASLLEPCPPRERPTRPDGCALEPPSG